jgi:S-adenosylmethionine hydrolase
MLTTLTTDFGVSSPYVAALKGSLLSTNPAASIVDLTHAIPPQDIRQAAVILADVTPFFPPGTLHMVVVDPGVGTERRILYVEMGEQRFLAPDNGVLSYLAQKTPPHFIVEIAEAKFCRSQVSNTFHGRDIFAPVAAQLLAGLLPADLGRVTNQMLCLDWREPQFLADEIVAAVLLVDSFGNLITNLPISDLQTWLGSSQLRIHVAGHEIVGLQVSYGQRQPGELIALGDSQGRLELAAVNGSAAEVLRLQPGEDVRIGRQIAMP